MDTSPRRRVLIAYSAILATALCASLLWGIITEHDLSSRIVPWILMTTLLGLSEYAALFFHARGARYSLSASEAVLLPMLVILSFPQAVLGATIANALGRSSRWRLAPLKEVFNTAQYGTAAAAASALWAALSENSTELTVRNAAVAIMAVTLFALLTHLFTSLAIALVDKRSVIQLSRQIGPAILLNLGGSVTVGLLLAAAYFSAAWTIALFPPFLAGLFFAYRAVLTQSKERERVEHIHAATQSLAASADLGHALSGFLGALAEVVSANEARVFVRVRGHLVCSSVRGQELTEVMEPVVDDVAAQVLALVASSDRTVRVDEDDFGPGRQLADDLGATGLIAAPILDEGDLVGCLMAMDRVGAGAFGDAEARLLEALSNELVIALDSYRLFSEVTEERERFHRIFEGSKEGICLIDSAGVVKAWNPALEQITGYAEAEVIGQPCCDKVLVRDSAQRRIEIEDVIKAAPEDEFELVTKQGPPRWISVLSGPTETAGERGWVVLVRDRTGEHAAEEAKSDFLATISHELRTPLTTIKGSLQVLGRDPSHLPPDTAEQMIDVLRRGADRLERLVLNLLFVSQVESGGVRLISEEIGLTEVVTNVLERVPEDPARVRLVMPAEEPVVRADREKLAQALEHLLDNAQKYGGPTGTIVVECERENGYARVSVTDEGPGVPKADQERIFERFVRLGNILTRETQGAGVGLFIARRSIEGMGGSIWVESEGGRGATFHIRIPLAHPVSVADEVAGA